MAGSRSEADKIMGDFIKKSDAVAAEFFMAKMPKLSMAQVIAIGKKLAAAKIVIERAPRSHSHNVASLFPQTEAQYKWLKKEAGTTGNVLIFKTVEEVLAVCPELEGYVVPTKSRQSCRINIPLIENLL